MLDVLIAGGQVVDGSGSPSRRADVGIRNGRIVAVGRFDERATRVLDADGMVVAPGFIDVHTHIDAQVFWDTALSPSPLHGVTTMLAGNCGFTVAPLTAEAAGYLMRMLAKVEGMPLEALEHGVPWDWTTTADYLRRLEGRLAVNTGFMVGHSALRRVVMGPAATERRATDDEVAAMAALLGDGLAAGGLGFSSGWGSLHHDMEGKPVPSRHASPDELVSLATVCNDYPGTSLEFVPTGGVFTDVEKDLLPRMTVAARRPLNWNLIHADAGSLQRHLDNLALSTAARRRGGRIVGLAMPSPGRGRFCFLRPFQLDGLPGWARPMALPPDERLRLLRDPEQRRRLNSLAQTTTTQAHIADWGEKVLTETFSPWTKPFEGRRVADIAAEEGKTPFDALLDIVCTDELRTTFSRSLAPVTDADWEARLRIWRDDRVLIGGSDAGAHLDFMSTFTYTTYLLGTAVRQAGALPLEEAVQMLTSAPAELYGLRERGVLRPGAAADVVVFDPDTVDSEPVRTRDDLPGGAARLYAGSVGMEHVLVNGVGIVEEGALTEARPGAVLRSGRDTTTPQIG